MKTQNVRPYNEYRETTNRYVYNKTRKRVLEKKGEIRCSYCSYHQNENSEKKYYGEIRQGQNKKSKFCYPNWKLVSKKKKQWMEGTFRKKTITYNRWDLKYEYVKFEV